MAQMQPIYTRAFILAVIICHGILSAEGRQLKPMKRQGGVQTVLSTKDTFPLPNTQTMELSAVAQPIDDFRPTTPGNSPGVGHSYTEHSVVVQPNGAGDVTNLLTKKSKQESTRKQKVHPIKAPRNMGKHGCRSVGSEKTSRLKEHEVQVALAYNSHCFEHTTVSTKEVFSPNDQSIGFSTVAKSIDGFRPTAPGNSPGVGHYTENDVKVQPKGVGNSLGVHHSIAGRTDDFRPTEPGHSPGVGHSFKDKNTEPNA